MPKKKQPRPDEIYDKHITVPNPFAHLPLEQQKRAREYQREYLMRTLARIKYTQDLDQDPDRDYSTFAPMVRESALEYALEKIRAEQLSQIDKKTGIYLESVLKAGYDEKILNNEGNNVSILLTFDVDNAKAINDNPNLGHDVLDGFLIAIGKICQNLRPTDIAARSSAAGDEFHVLLNNVPPENIEAAVRSIHQKISELNSTCIENPVARTRAEMQGYKNFSISMGALVIRKSNPIYFDEARELVEAGLNTAKGKGKRAFTLMDLQAAERIKIVGLSNKPGEGLNYESRYVGNTLPAPLLEDRKREVHRTMQRIIEVLDIALKQGNIEREEHEIVERCLNRIGEIYHKAVNP